MRFWKRSLAKSGPRTHRTGGWLGIACLLFGLGLATSGRGEELDPSVPVRLAVRPARGAAVADRLDLGATNLSRVRLPRDPVVTFQVRVTGSVIGSPLADERGRLLVAHGTGRLTELDARGKTTWTLRVGELLGAPVALGGARALAVTKSAEVLAVSSQGRVISRERLPFDELEGQLVAAPAADGGAIVAAGARYVRVDEVGAVVLTGTAQSQLGAVFDWRGSTLLVEREGRVLGRAPALDPTVIANFGAPVPRASLVGDRLFAIVGEHALAVLDLRTRRIERRFADPLVFLRDLTLNESGAARLLASRGMVVELDPTFAETGRVMLLSDGALGESVTLIADREGTLLAVMNGAPLLLAPRGGEPSAVASTGCPDPLRPTPLVDGVLVIGCRSGVLRGLSDRAR
jgi:hypothetical protein